MCGYNSQARACLCVRASCGDMESEPSKNQWRKYAKGCLQAKNNHVVCFCSIVISVVMSAARKDTVSMNILLYFDSEYSTDFSVH